MALVLNETANQTVNQTANQSANTASQASSQFAMLQDPVFMGAIAAGILAGAAYLLIKYVKKRQEDEPYQGKSLQERLKEKQINPTLEFGKKPGKKEDYDTVELGQCEKIYSTTEKTAEGILEELHGQDPEDLEHIEDDDLSSKNDEFKNYTMIIGPTGFLNRLKMRAKSSDPVSNPYLSVYSPPASKVNVGDRIQISGTVDWNYSGGIYYSKDVQGITTMYNFSSLSLIDDLTKVFSNKGEITQALNEKFAEWKSKKEVENESFIKYMKEKEGIDADNATD